MQKCENLVTEDLGILDVQVVRAKRRVSRNNKPGIVKVELRSLDEKKKVLRQKMKLKQTDTFKETYIRRLKSHVERILELNTQTLLNELPFGQNYSITAKGRLVPNNPQMGRRNYGSGPGQYQDGSSWWGQVHWQQQQHQQNQQQQNAYPQDTVNLIPTQFQPPLPQMMVPHPMMDPRQPAPWQPLPPQLHRGNN